MFKKSHRGMAIILAVALLVGMTPTMAFAGIFRTPFNLVVFGASTTNGYGLHGYVDEKFYKWLGTNTEQNAWETKKFDPNAETWSPHSRFDVSVSGYRNTVPGSTPDVLQEKLQKQMPTKKVVLHQLAQSSMRAEELRVLLDNNYDGDKFTEWRFSAGQNWFEKDGGVKKLRADYQKTTKNADLIVYDLGANNFGCYIANRIISNYYSSDFANIYGNVAAKMFYEVRDRLESYIEQITQKKLSKATLKQVDYYLDTIAYAVAGYCVNFDKTMKKIYKLNPDVDVVVMNIQNPMIGMNVSYEGFVIPFGDLMSLAIEMANDYTANKSPYRNKYYYADAFGKNGRVEAYVDKLISYNGKVKTLDKNMLDCANVYDNDIFLREEVVKLCEGKIKIGSKKYNQMLNAAYDALFTILQYPLKSAAASVAPLLSGLTSGSDILRNTTVEWKKNVATVAVGAAGCVAENGDYKQYVKKQLATIYQDEATVLISSLMIRMDYGNSFFAHPTYKGSETQANAILNAYNKKFTSKDIKQEIKKNRRIYWSKLGIKYGTRFGVSLLSKINAGSK